MERARQYEARRIADRQRLDALLAYVKAPGCRNQVILEYLGEPEPPKCGRCDNCLRSREAALAASTEATRLGASLTRQLDDDAVEHGRSRSARSRRASCASISRRRGAPVAAADAAPAPLRRRCCAGAAALRRRSPAPHPSAAPAAASRRAGHVARRAKPAPAPVASAAARGRADGPKKRKPPQAHDDDLDDDDEDDDELDDDEDDDELDDDDRRR